MYSPTAITKPVCILHTRSISNADMIIGFKSQSMLLARMFYFVESGKIQEPVYTPEQAPAGTANKDFLRDFVGNLLQTAFPNLQM